MNVLPLGRFQSVIAVLGCAFLAGVLLPAHAQVVRTGYSPLIASGSGKCLDIAGSSLNSGAGAVQYHCNFTPTQYWTVQPYGGAFRLIVNQGGQCLLISHSSSINGARAVQGTCTGAKGELWSFSASGNAWQIVSTNSGKCLYVTGGSTSDGSQIIQSTCDGTTASKWVFMNDLVPATGVVILQAGHSGQCLYVPSAASSTSVVQYPCSGNTAEQWSVIPAGNSMRLVSKNGGLCLTVSGSGAANGARLVQLACSSSASQLWNLKPGGAVGLQIQSASSALCATVQGASQAPGAAVIQSACGVAPTGLWSMTLATLRSSWSPVIPLPLDPIAMANLPDGRILMWSADSPYTFLSDIGLTPSKTYTGIFDPATHTATRVIVSNTGHDMFCPGTANLSDGRILVNGGSSSPRTSLYDPETGLWKSDANMNIPRGYEGDTPLSNGSVLTLGGSWSGGLGGKTAEVWTSSAGWRVLPGVTADPVTGPDPKGVYRGDNHLWLFATSNERVFHAGPTATMHWIDTRGSGTISSAGSRGGDGFSINGNAVMFDIGLILKAGGAPAYSDSDARTSAYLIDINSGANVSTLAPMAYRRGFSNAVALPNGQVVIIGGQTHPVPFTDTTAVLIPELWDPKTRVFRRLAAMKTPRVYHSTAILLADGRVMAAGGGQCGSGCAQNHFDTEILTPPYLLDANGNAAVRPRITRVADSASLGGMLPISTDGPVVSFVLMRLSSVTHTVNNDQRRVPLKIISTGGATAYTVQIPSDPGIALPGYYMLFALNAWGVPSIASTVLIYIG